MRVRPAILDDEDAIASPRTADCSLQRSNARTATTAASAPCTFTPTTLTRVSDRRPSSGWKRRPAGRLESLGLQSSVDARTFYERHSYAIVESVTFQFGDEEGPAAEMRTNL